MRSSAIVLLASAAAVAAQVPQPPCHQYAVDEPKLETPCNIVLRNATGYVIRAYGLPSEQAFTNGAVHADSFSDAQGQGFQLSFNYIEGANSAKAKIPMTGPVIVRTSDHLEWNIGFFVPQSLYPTTASIPAPTEANVTISTLPLTAFAIIEFPGFATEADFMSNAATLRQALARDGVQTVADSWGEVWAAYDSPYTIFNRHNEVWVHVKP